MDAVERQRIGDGAQLRALAIAYFVLGGMAAFSALIALAYIAMGVVIGTVAGAAESGGSEEGAAVVRMLLGAFGTAIFVSFGVVSALQITTGISLLRARRRTGLSEKARNGVAPGIPYINDGDDGGRGFFGGSRTTRICHIRCVMPYSQQLP